MNILLVNTLYYPYKVGGAEVSVKLLAEGLVNKGHKVTVASMHDGKKTRVEIINGVNVIYLPYKNKYWQFDGVKHNAVSRLVWHIIDCYNLKYYKVFSELISEINPDIVHTNNLSGLSVSVWKAAKKKGCKIVHTSRDYYLLHPNCKLYKNGKDISIHSFAAKSWSWVKKIHSKKVDYYVGISDFIKNLHMEAGFFQNAKVTTIYNAVDFNDETINNLKIKPDKPQNIGFIGRLTKEKGFDIFCKLAGRNKDKKFIAAGEFDHESGSLIKDAKDNNVQLLGYCPVDKFMQLSDVIVLPIIWHEPFGRVVVESIVAGKSVLTNRVGGIGELATLLPNIFFFEDTQKIDDIPSPVKPDTRQLKIFSAEYVTNEYLKVYEGI